MEIVFGEATFLSEEKTNPSPSGNNRDVPKGELCKECNLPSTTLAGGEFCNEFNLPPSPLASGEFCEPCLLSEKIY